MILDSILKILLKYTPAKGWPVKEIIDDFFIDCVVELNQEGLEDQIDILEKWKFYCADIIDEKIDQINLCDDSNNNLTAFTYMLMRRDPHRLINVQEDSAVKVGDNVRSMALSFAAIREGFRGLSYELKSLDPYPSRMLARYALIIIKSISILLKREMSSFPKVEKRIKSKSLMNSEAQIFSGEALYYRKGIQFKKAFSKVITDLEFLFQEMYQMDLIDENSIIISSNNTDKMKNPVEISLVPESQIKKINYRATVKSYLPKKKNYISKEVELEKVKTKKSPRKFSTKWQQITRLYLR